MESGRTSQKMSTAALSTNISTQLSSVQPSEAMANYSRSSSHRRHSSASRSSRRSSRGSRQSSKSKRRAVNSFRRVLKELWLEYRALYREKRGDAQQKERRGQYCEGAVVAIQAISLTTLILTVIVTAVKKSFEHHQLVDVIWRGVFELILTVAVVVTISRTRDALRSIVVSLYLVAVIVDVYLLERKMRGNYRFLCTPDDTNCLGWVGFRYDYVLNLLVCVILHMSGALFSALALNLHSQASWDSKSSDYMRMAIKKNRKLVKRQKRRLKKQAKKQRDSIHVITSSDWSSLSRRSKSSTRSTRRTNSKRSSQRSPSNFV